MTSTALQKYESEAEAVYSGLSQVSVQSHSDYEKAADYLTDVKTSRKRIEEERTKITQPLNASLKATNTFFKRVDAKYEQAEDYLKTEMVRFLDRERARETQLLLEAAEGNMTALSLATEAAPTAKGVSVRNTLKFRIVNEAEIPRNYLVPDESKIRAAVKAGLEIPGVETYVETSLAAGTK